MTLPLNNTADSGPDETAVTTANSGSSNGDAFDAVTITGGPVVFDADQRRWGPYAYRMDLGTAIGNCFVVYSTKLGTITDLVARSYLRLSALPSSNLLIRQYRGAAANRGLIRVQSSGIPQILNAASTAVHTFGTALPVNTWIRLEESWHFDVAAGTARAAFWWNDTSSRTCDSIGTATMDSGALTALALGGSVDTANIGVSAAAAQASAASWWLDELTLRASGTLPLGPPTEWWAATGSGLQPLRSAFQGDPA